MPRDATERRHDVYLFDVSGCCSKSPGARRVACVQVRTGVGVSRASARAQSTSSWPADKNRTGLNDQLESTGAPWRPADVAVWLSLPVVSGIAPASEDDVRAWLLHPFPPGSWRERSPLRDGAEFQCSAGARGKNFPRKSLRSGGGFSEAGVSGILLDRGTRE